MPAELLPENQPEGSPKPRHFNYVHGHSVNRKMSKTYKAWRNMLSRCYNPNDKCFKHYGARGIGVCEEWRHCFDAFLTYVGVAPAPNMTMERKDNARNYEPGNVKWADRWAQAGNKRNNRMVTVLGETGHFAKPIRGLRRPEIKP